MHFGKMMSIAFFSSHIYIFTISKVMRVASFTFCYPSHCLAINPHQTENGLVAPECNELEEGTFQSINA
jgi:hypothetical protein